MRIFHLTPNGEEPTVNILARRRLIGEFALIDGQPRSAAAKAITACTLLEMPCTRYLHHLEHIPTLALAMRRQLVHEDYNFRFRPMTTKIANCSCTV